MSSMDLEGAQATDVVATPEQYPEGADKAGIIAPDFTKLEKRLIENSRVQLSTFMGTLIDRTNEGANFTKLLEFVSDLENALALKDTKEVGRALDEIEENYLSI